jgi:hypothetical protein
LYNPNEAGFAGMMIPPAGEQDPADIHEQQRDWALSFHLSSVNAVCYP